VADCGRRSGGARMKATVVIVTKDRRDELRDALRSATGQRQPLLEVLVVDDGSADGTADMVRAEFASVRVKRFETSAGLVVRRNDAAELATGDVIFSLDDDAVFTTPDVVAQTMAEFDHPRIGAIAIPYIDVRRGPEEHQRAPVAHGRWATPVFRGTAHALRRDVFLRLGGYRGSIVHQGEEIDFALRMLDGGFVVRLGNADPIHHFESPSRSMRRMEFYFRRNEILLATTYFRPPVQPRRRPRVRLARRLLRRSGRARPRRAEGHPRRPARLLAAAARAPAHQQGHGAGAASAPASRSAATRADRARSAPAAGAGAVTSAPAVAAGARETTRRSRSALGSRSCPTTLTTQSRRTTTSPT
jgi:GT2 family glycosyltransferase